jgi:chromosome segregation ATPase
MNLFKTCDLLVGCRALRAALESERQLVNELVAELEKSEADRASFEKSTSAATLECKRLANAVTELQETCAMARLAETTLRESLMEREKTNAECLARIESLRTDVKAHQERSEHIAASEASARAKYSEASRELERLRGEVTALNAEIGKRSKQGMEMTAKASEQNAMIEALEAERARLQEEIAVQRVRLK